MRNALQSNVLHLYSEKYNSVPLLYMLSKKDGKTATMRTKLMILHFMISG